MGKETMTSRERVTRALEHKSVDRYPIDLGMHYSTGISAFAYKDLREYLGLNADTIEIVDAHQFLARVDGDVLERFHCDCVMLHPGFLETRRWRPRGKYEFIVPKRFDPVLRPDGNWFVTNGAPGVGITMPEGGYFFDGVGYDWWGEDEDEIIRRYGKNAERLYKETDYFTMYVSYGGFIGDFDFMCDMLTDPDKIMEINERALQWHITHVSKLIEAAGPYIGGITTGGDLGTQVGPIMNPKVYERLVYPYMKRFIDFVKANSDFKVFYHCCGAIDEFIPYLIDEGVDALNPVQVSAKGMEPRYLKEKYGGKIAFWGGGCDTQNILCMCGPDEVRRNVRALSDVFKQNSGFVFNQVHNVMGNIPPENIAAMLDEAYENAFYTKEAGENA